MGIPLIGKVWVMCPHMVSGGGGGDQGRDLPKKGGGLSPEGGTDAEPEKPTDVRPSATY